MIPDRPTDLLEKQLSMLIGLYQHHLDLFVKWMTLFAGVVGGIAIYLFNQDIDPFIRRMLPLLIAAASCVAAIGCLLMGRWLKRVEQEVKNVSTALEECSCPFLGVTMTVAALVVTSVFAVASTLYAVFGVFQ